MEFLPRDQAKLIVLQAGFLAKQRLARGLRLNQAEATALIESQLLERIVDGEESVEQLVEYGKVLLGRRHVLPGVPTLLRTIQVEGTFPDGQSVVTVHEPICTPGDSLEAALYGSCYPVPDPSLFPLAEPDEVYSIPGALVLGTGPIVIDPGRAQWQKRFAHAPELDTFQLNEEKPRETYAAIFGPTTGDRIRLGDTSLWIQVERDVTLDKDKSGDGKTAHDETNTPDLVITNALIVDWSGIYKADVGVRNGRICGIGRAGDPSVMTGVNSALVVGPATEVIAGEKFILTAGAIDAHVLDITPQHAIEALSAGTTTTIIGGSGVSAGMNVATYTSNQFYVRQILAATDGLPTNLGFMGRGYDSDLRSLEDIIRAGAIGLKLYEEDGSTPAAIKKAAEEVGEEYDVQISTHADTLSKGGSDEVLPYTQHTLDEHLNRWASPTSTDPSDVPYQRKLVAAEYLHDLGAIPTISSDSQATRRVGEVVNRTWRTASKMREFRGPLTKLGDTEDFDNGRVKRYISKYTINPALKYGISHLVGQVAVGTIADLVLWRPDTFGIRPDMVLKSGVIAWAQMDDANLSIPTVQPFSGQQMWGAHPGSAALNSVVFVSQVSVDTGVAASYGLRKRREPVKGASKVKEEDMKWQDAISNIQVDPASLELRMDGPDNIERVTKLALARNYNFF